MKRSYVCYAYSAPVNGTRDDEFLGGKSFESPVVSRDDESIKELTWEVSGHVFGPYSSRGRGFLLWFKS